MGVAAKVLRTTRGITVLLKTRLKHPGISGHIPTSTFLLIDFELFRQKLRQPNRAPVGRTGFDEILIWQVYRFQNLNDGSAIADLVIAYLRNFRRTTDALGKGGGHEACEELKWRAHVDSGNPRISGTTYRRKSPRRKSGEGFTGDARDYRH